MFKKGDLVTHISIKPPNISDIWIVVSTKFDRGDQLILLDDIIYYYYSGNFKLVTSILREEE